MTKLNNSIVKLDRDQVTAAINQLNAFMNQVRGWINAGVLSAATGQSLLDAVQAVITDILE